MARWTQSYSDCKHISRIGSQLPISAILQTSLQTGRIIEGVLRRFNVGNNAGNGGWCSYGEVEIETKDHQRWVLDYLDIERITDVSTPERLKEYEDLGLIEIVPK